MQVPSDIIAVRSVNTYFYLSDIPELFDNKKLCDKVSEILCCAEYKGLLGVKEAYAGYYLEFEWELPADKALVKTQKVFQSAINRAMRELRIKAL